MQKLIEIEKDDSILVSSQVESFLRPDMVYLPISIHDQFLVKKNDLVRIGDEIVRNVFSPVSGVVHSLKKKNSLEGEKIFLEIENDFEERRKGKVGLKRRITKERVLDYLPLEDKKILVLNAIDDEIYVSTQNFYLFCYYEEFLGLLDEIHQLFCLDAIYVCLKASSSENINQLMNDLGMYPDIILKVVPDLYLLSKPEFLLSYLGIGHDQACVVYADQFYRIYNDLKRGRTMSDILITISGDAIKNPMVVQVKLGSLLKDVVLVLVSYKSKDVEFIANGLLSGKKIDLDNFVVTSSLSSLLIMKKKGLKKEGKCINCGLCSEVCPVHLNPILFKDPKYQEQMKKQCIKCGLCTYICPVYIHFLED